MPDAVIRAFAPSDRQAVRDICCDTADMGQPVERIFPDRAWAADLLTSYYTDYEPSSIFVADLDGVVAGYILGCLDNRCYGLVMFWILGPQFVFKGLARGVFFRRQIWRLLGGAARNWRRAFVWRKQSFHSHQGHLHIGIAQGFRSRRLGQRLVEALMLHARGRHIEELTASVHDGNVGACRFFDRIGFQVRERYPMIGPAGPYHSLLYVKKTS